jgi:hypothetical protein
MSTHRWLALGVLFVWPQSCGTALDLVELNRSDLHSCVSGFDSTGRTAWITQTSPDFATSQVLESRRSARGWSTPRRLPVSEGLETGMNTSRDGGHLLLTSRRPAGEPADRWNLWSATSTEDGWSAARPLPAPVNGPDADCCGVLGPFGEIYFSSTRGGSWDIHLARPTSGGGYRVERLGPAVNRGEPGPPDEGGRDGEWPSYVDPESRFILFSSIRAGGSGGDDIHLAEWSDGVWKPAVNLGSRVNTAGYEDCATLTPDGRYLVWSSRTAEPGATSQIQVLPVDQVQVFAEIPALGAASASR